MYHNSQLLAMVDHRCHFFIGMSDLLNHFLASLTSLAGLQWDPKCRQTPLGHVESALIREEP